MKDARLFYLFSMILLCGLGGASLLMGLTQMEGLQALKALMGQGREAHILIMQDLRVPRLILSLMIGATLGLGGAAMQGLLRNPLADPSVIGVTASAGLGAVVAIFFGLGAVVSFAIPMTAMIFAAVTCIILMVVMKKRGGILTLILAGVALSSIATALMSLMINFSGYSATLQEMVLWLLGSLHNRSMNDVYMSLPFMMIGWGLIFSVGRYIDAFSLGEDGARSLGVDIQSVQWRIVMGVACSVGAAVAVCGAVGFIGLIVPHMMRYIFGAQPSRILLPSAVSGGLILTAADMITRLDMGQGHLKLGVVTALIGAPLFLYLVVKLRREGSFS